MALDLHSLKQRRELSPRREPYWSAPLDSGLHLGFRKIGEEGERNGTWIARLHRPDTKAHTYSSLGVESNDFDYVKACKAAQQWAKEVETGADPANAPTVRQACEAYIEWLRSKKGDKSAYDGEVRFKRAVYEHPAIADVRLTRRAFRSDTIIKWRNGLAGTAANKNRMLVALRAALNHAWREGKVSGDVADAWRRVSRIAKTADGEDVEGRRELRLDLEQRRALVAELTGNVRDLVSFVCVTGCRPGEAAQLRVGNWSSTGKTIIFKRSKT
jgi:integrase